MNDLRQIQLQLFGPPRLAGLRTLEDGRSIASLAGPVAASFDSQVVYVSQVSFIGRDLLQDQSADRHLLFVAHNQPSVAETMSPTEQVTLCATAIHKSRNQRAG